MKIFFILALQLFSIARASQDCPKELLLIVNADIKLPHGISATQLAYLIKAFGRIPERHKFEALVISGSRTHFNFGHQPQVDASGNVTSDTDLQLIPAEEFFRSPAFDREWPKLAPQAIASLMHGPQKLPKVEFVLQPNLQTPLTTLARMNRLSSSEIEEGIGLAATEYQNENGPWSSRDAERRFYLSRLGRATKAGDISAMHTTEAVIFIKENGAKSQQLEASLKARGFKQVIVVP